MTSFGTYLKLGLLGKDISHGIRYSFLLFKRSLILEKF